MDTCLCVCAVHAMTFFLHTNTFTHNFIIVCWNLYIQILNGAKFIDNGNSNKEKNPAKKTLSLNINAIFSAAKCLYLYLFRFLQVCCFYTMIICGTKGWVCVFFVLNTESKKKSWRKKNTHSPIHSPSTHSHYHTLTHKIHTRITGIHFHTK